MFRDTHTHTHTCKRARPGTDAQEVPRALASLFLDPETKRPGLHAHRSWAANSQMKTMSPHTLFREHCPLGYLDFLQL